MPRLIEVVEYCTDWPTLYAKEAERLRAAFGNSLAAMHHTGSTSVPGLAAKPVIDILVEVVPGTDIPEYYSQMAELGYDCRGECLDAEIPGTPGRYYFSLKRNGVHYLHMHVCEVGHQQIREFLVFRDYLREHSDEAKRYGELKKRLAAKFSYNNMEYMRGKDGFIKQLLGSAEKWRSTGRDQDFRGT